MKDLPNYLCGDCAEEIKKENNITTEWGDGFTAHLAQCSICKEGKGVATPYDWGIYKDNVINWD